MKTAKKPPKHNKQYILLDTIKKGWPSVDDFNIAINRSVLININGNKSQKSCEHIIRTFSVQASCGILTIFSRMRVLAFQKPSPQVAVVGEELLVLEVDLGAVGAVDAGG